MSKNYFGILDTRNTKYQGLLKNDSYNGIGILIDNLFTTVVTSWNKFIMNGPSFIVFPYLQIFFGELENNSPKGLICFQPNQREKFIINFLPNSQNKGVYEISNIAHVVLKQSIALLQKDGSNQSYKIVQTFYCKKQQDQLKILSNIFKIKVLRQNVFLSDFLQKNYVQNHPQFQLTGKNQLFFGFKNTSSLGVKIQNNLPIAIGNFSNFPRNLNIGRKIYYNLVLPNKTKIQQGNFEQSTKIHSFFKENGPSLECQKSLQQYFKKSTTFRNQFTKLDNLDNLCIQFKRIQKLIKQQTSKIFGQTLLQNDYGSSNQNQKQQVIVKQYTLSQVRQEIYQAAARKKGGYIKTQRSITKTPPIKKHVESLYIDDIQSSERRQINRSRSKKQYLDAHDRNQVSLKVPYQITSRQINYNQNSLVQRSKQSYKHHNKPSLIKEVNQRIQSEKQLNRALLNELIRQQQFKRQLIFQQKLRNIKNSAKRNQNTSPRSRSPYSIIERKSSPFIAKQRSSQKKDKRTNLKRTYNYINKQNQHQVDRNSFNYKGTPIQRLQSNRSTSQLNRNGNSHTISPFKLSQFPRQSTNIAHDHLTKYKQRKRQSTQSQIDKHKQNNRYSYLQNEQQVPDFIAENLSFNQNQNRNHTIQQNKYMANQSIPEIKLFGKQNYNNKSYVHKKSQFDDPNFKKYQFKKNLTPTKTKKTFHYVD